MKLVIDQSPEHSEVEITIKCGVVDERLGRLIEQIRMYSLSVAGKRDGSTYQLPLNSIYYFESVEGKTFVYQESDVYECDETLSQLEQLLEEARFVRISKSCLLNISKLVSVRAMINRRMEAQLSNGEKLIINRHYVNGLKHRLNMLGEQDNG